MRKIKPKKKNKKGLSPVIATVLLIAMVVVIALIIFLWFKGLTEEVITKFGKKNIKLACDDVKFQAGYGGGSLSISNTGTVPIYSFTIKMIKPGSHTSDGFKNPQQLLNLNWPALGLNQGEAFASGDLSTQLPTGTEELVLIPVLVGKTKKGAEKIHTCEERHGYKISL